MCVRVFIQTFFRNSLYRFPSVYSTPSQVNIDTLRQYSAFPFPPPFFPHPPLYSDSHANGIWYLLFCAIQTSTLHIHCVVIIVVKANVVEFQARGRECLQDKRYICTITSNVMHSIDGQQDL